VKFLSFVESELHHAWSARAPFEEHLKVKLIVTASDC